MKKSILWGLYLLVLCLPLFVRSECFSLPLAPSSLSASPGCRLSARHFPKPCTKAWERTKEMTGVSKGAGIQGWPNYALRLYQGDALGQFAPFIAEQRVTLFAEYPYLYQASVEDDMPYATWFSQLPKSAAVIAYYQDQPIGVIAGTSFKDFGEHFQGSIALFEDAQLNPESYFYISEVIIMPEHRGEGLSTQLFEIIESFAKQAGYTKACFVTESHEKHPLKPANYRDLDLLWKKLGYSLMNLSLQFSWPTLQADSSSKMQEHRLEYWQKDLYLHPILPGGTHPSSGTSTSKSKKKGT